MTSKLKTAALPPLPDELPAPKIDLADFERIFPHIRSVRAGCYLLNYTPVGATILTYDGTLRVQAHPGGRTASGDLYQRPPRIVLFPRPHLEQGPPPDPAAGIPIFPRAQHRFYVSVTKILEFLTVSDHFDLGFDLFEYNTATRVWDAAGSFTATMNWVAAPPGYPLAHDYLTGTVKNAAGAIAGQLTMGWVSAFLRKATIEIDRVAHSESPRSNGAGVDWQAVGKSVDWDITVDHSQSNIPEASGESWSDAECHAAMLDFRDRSNLDAEWRYHVLCVRRLDSTERGIMYDVAPTDSNNVPREGCAISSHWTMPAHWGLVGGMRFGAVPTVYFRTAVHETGHAMGLYHRWSDHGYMCTTDVIEAEGTPASPFPNDILWAYSPADQKNLRHLSDLHVRPGGIPFGDPYLPLSPDDEEIDMPGVSLEVKPIATTVPLGAPVRVTVKLTNLTATAVPAPSTLSLKSSFVAGQVTDPSGTDRTFSPLVLCVDGHALRELKPGDSVEDSLTLLRGGEGPLFGGPGTHRIRVKARWQIGSVTIAAAGEAAVMVTAAVDKDHGEAAMKVLSTPDTLLTLVLGGDHMKEGIEAIDTALKNPVLRPHYAYIEAKRLAQRFGTRAPDLGAAAKLIASDTVMSPAESAKAGTFAKAAAARAR